MKYLIPTLLIFSLYSPYALSAAGENSFTPESILVPIRGISVSNADDSITENIYTCDTDCLIDITDDAALETLTTNAEITVGTYTKVSIGTCKNEGSYFSRVKGSVVLSGTTYYTSSGGEPLVTVIGENDYVNLEHSGCGNEYILPQPLVVTESGATDEDGNELGATANLNLFMALPNIAWGRLSGEVTVPGGCTAGVSTSVCIAYPDVVPYVGDTVPTLEIFHIADDTPAPESDSGGQLQCIFSASGEFIGGFARRLFSETSVPHVANFDTAFSTHEIKEDGNLVIADYGDSPDTFQMKFPNLNRDVVDAGVYTYYNPSEATRAYVSFPQ
jgi:hypothetical protein